MILLSLLLNLVVLVPVVGLLLGRPSWAEQTYGPPTPARGILVSIYGSILVASAGLLWAGDAGMVSTLLALQVLYKVSAPFTVGSATHPVVASNLAIAAFHTATLATVWVA
jgi:hypothetical protein